MPPHTEWGATATDEYEVADYLSTFKLDSDKVVEIDSWLITSIFQQQKRKKASRTHHVQQLHPDAAFKLDSATAKGLQTIFEKNKGTLVHCNFQNAIDFGKTMHKEIKAAYPELVASRAHALVITWCSIAYGYIVSNPESGVRLRVRLFAGGNERGFSITSTRDLVQHEVLYSLMGLMPDDAKAEHSRLSEIEPHPSQLHNKANAEKPRILIGPIRFINHACRSYNAEYVAVKSKLAFVVQTTKAIKSGEEIFVNYGDTYFEDLPGGRCPCRDCVGEGSREAKSKIESEDSEGGSKQEAYKARRKRKKLRATVGGKEDIGASH